MMDPLIRIEHLDGLFTALLDKQELATFDRECASGRAYRSYEGAAGFMGLSRVRLRERPQR